MLESDTVQQVGSRQSSNKYKILDAIEIATTLALLIYHKVLKARIKCFSTHINLFSFFYL
jgi:hypothetical protein